MTTDDPPRSRCLSAKEAQNRRATLSQNPTHCVSFLDSRLSKKHYNPSENNLHSLSASQNFFVFFKKNTSEPKNLETPDGIE